MKRNRQQWLWAIGIVVLTLLTTALAWGDIEVADTVKPYEPIVAKVTITGVPEGAKLRGSFQVTDAQYIQVDEQTFHLWAKPGTHAITAQGVWVLTKDVTVEGQTFPVLLDFGQYIYNKSFVVEGGDDPVPPPPPPPGTRIGVILEESADRTPAQGLLWAQLRKEYQPGRMLILDDDQPEAQKYLPLSKLTQRPVLLVLTDKGALVREVSAPSSVADVAKEMAK